jgi:hypothetical protein
VNDLSNMLRGASTFALLSLTIDLVPLVMAIVYVARPTERNLSLMRPLSLAGIFSALSGTVVGVLNLLRGVAIRGHVSPDFSRIAILGASEALVPVFVGFASLTFAWLLVAVGMVRSRDAA